MTLRLNDGGVMTCASPARVELFTDAGSLCHLALGFVAGSRLVSPKDAVIMLAAFTGYQVSQASGGESWSRIGGELIEFVLGMLIARFLPALFQGMTPALA